MTTNDIKALYDLAEDVLLKWLDTPPTDRRQIKALELLADAGQNLHAACINLGVVDQIGDDE